MKLSALYSFVTVAECGSFTKAAEKLFVTQPTLSRQIQELEDELGTQLFRRDYRSLKLSEDGILFLIEAKDLLRRSENAAQMFRMHEKEYEELPRLRIGYQQRFDSAKVYAVIPALRKEYEDLDLLITEDPARKLLEDLMNDRLDIVFILSTFLPANGCGLTAIPIDTSSLKLIVPASHRLASQTQTAIRELRNEPFILLNRMYSPAIVDYVIHLCMQNGFTPDCKYYADDSDRVVELVASGQGISFLHSGMRLKMLSEYYPIASLDVEEIDQEFRLAAVYKTSSQNPVLHDLLRLLGLETSA